MLREKKEIYCWKREINLLAEYVMAKFRKDVCMVKSHVSLQLSEQDK